MSNIHEKLMNVQSKLKAPKNQYNSFGKYSYRNCEDILEALKPILLDIKATVTLEDDVIQIGDRYYIKATAMFTDCENGESILKTAFAREEENKKGMDFSQVTGSTSSYARKYALNGLFCIDDTKDSDFTNTHGKENKIKAKELSKIESIQPKVYKCYKCSAIVQENVAKFSYNKFKKILCINCQKGVK